MMFRPRALPLALSLCCAISLPALADEMAPVVVTATRTAQTADQTLASVTVISRADIERLQARSVEELLSGLAGVTLANNGGRGKQTSLFLRGTSSSHVLFLIDGIRVGSATTGAAAFQDFPVDQIERIEIVRGPRSALYGSEAIGGVIQIFTRKGGGDTRLRLDAGAGSHRTWTLGGGVSGGGDRHWYNLQLSGEDTDGFNACTGSSTAFAGCFTEEPDDDGYRNLSLSLRAGTRFDNGASLDLSLLRADTEVEYDGSFQNETAGLQQVLGASLELPLGETRLGLRVGQSRDEADNFKDGTAASRFDTRRNSAGIQLDTPLGEAGLVTFGGDWYDDRVSSTTAYDRSSRDNKALFAQYLGNFDRFDLEAALRRDDNEQFGGHTTGSLALGHNLDNGLRLTASYGTAFKAPTFNDLYFPSFSNPNLQPETSKSLEFGLSGVNGGLRWAAQVYETRIDDLIAFDGSFVPQNISKARIRGLELTLAGRIGTWDARANAGFMDPEHRGDDANRGNQLTRRARRSLRIDVDREFGAVQFGGTLRAESRRYDNLANTRAIGGYATVDLRLGWQPARDWTLGLRAANLFDRDYELVSYYPQDGRNFMLTLRYRPER